MLKASDTRASFVKSRVMANLVNVGRWALVVLVVCLAFIGFLHLTRGTAVRQVRGVAVDGVPVGVSEPEFPLMATMATGAWLAHGNRVEVMLNGDGGAAYAIWTGIGAVGALVVAIVVLGESINAARVGMRARRIGSDSHEVVVALTMSDGSISALESEWIARQRRSLQERRSLCRRL